MFRRFRAPRDNQETLETLAEKLTALQDSVNNRLDTLEDKLDIVAGTKAESTSQAHAVAICPFQHRHPLGHGLIFYGFWLLTAAHVVIDLLGERLSQTTEAFAIQPMAAPSKFYEVDVSSKDVFIPFEYIAKGQNDVGIVKLNFKNIAGPVCKQLHLSSARIKPLYAKCVGELPVRGDVEEVCAHNRLRIRGTSEPGCSGAALFDPSGNVAAILHGPGKHRNTKHSLGDRCYHVYVDSLLETQAFLKVKPKDDLLRVLVEAEEIDEEDAESPEKEYDYEREGASAGEGFGATLSKLWRSLREAVPEDADSLPTKVSLDSVMGLMAKRSLHLADSFPFKAGSEEFVDWTE